MLISFEARSCLSKLKSKNGNNISQVPVSTVKVNSIGLKGNAMKVKVAEGVYSSAIHTGNFYTWISLELQYF